MASKRIVFALMAGVALTFFTSLFPYQFCISGWLATCQAVKGWPIPIFSLKHIAARGQSGNVYYQERWQFLGVAAPIINILFWTLVSGGSYRLYGFVSKKLSRQG